MKTILMFGGKGWIGQLYAQHTRHNVRYATTRPEHYEACYEEIKRVQPDTLFCCIGRTHGPGCSSIDYLEDPSRHAENLRDNYEGPLTLARICQDLRIHMVYIGTGCIYNDTETHQIFTEDDPPNFFGSQYSIVKGRTDQDIRAYDVVLNVRIRMPISYQAHPRNFIDKLVHYPRICSIPNSMTVLESCFPTWDCMIEEKTTGTYNFTNPGIIDHNTILKLYQEWIDPLHTWTTISYQEQRRLLKSDRSNNQLDSSKWVRYAEARGLCVLSIDKMIKCVLRAREAERQTERALLSIPEHEVCRNQSHTACH